MKSETPPAVTGGASSAQNPEQWRNLISVYQAPVYRVQPFRLVTPEIGKLLWNVVIRP